MKHLNNRKATVYFTDANGYQRSKVNLKEIERVTKYNRRRYKLHAQLKKQGITYNALKETIEIPHKQEVLSEAVLELRDKFNYSVQLIIV